MHPLEAAAQAAENWDDSFECASQLFCIKDKTADWLSIPTDSEYG